VYETYEHQTQRPITPKLTLINLVLPKGFNVRILQILALSSIRLQLLESLENYNTYIVNMQYKCQSMSECIPTHSIVIIHWIHQQNKYSHHILKCVDIALPSSKNALSCCENELIVNT
jgi:hypothetical protein